MEKLNIYQKMLSITGEAQQIPKKGYNKFSDYYYVRAVDVIAEINKLFVKYGIQLNITEKSIERIKLPDSKNYHCTIKCGATFTNVDNINEKIEVDYYGVAADTLDKDLYKAKTNGLKYLLTQQFMIITDILIDAEDPKNEPAKPEVKPEPKAEIKPEVKKPIDDIKENQKMTQWLVKNSYDVVGIEKVYQKQLNTFTESDRVKLKKEVAIFKIEKATK